MAKEREYTTSSLFLLRPLGIINKDENVTTSRIADFGFLDAFIKDVTHDVDYTHPVFLLFKQDHLIAHFSEYLEEEYARGLLLEDYDYPNGFIVLVYDYPMELRSDYEKILAGKYSQVSKEFQAYFPETQKLRGREIKSIYARVFNKDPETRRAYEIDLDIVLPPDSEVMSSPYIDKETLDIKKYIQ